MIVEPYKLGYNGHVYVARNNAGVKSEHGSIPKDNEL